MYFSTKIDRFLLIFIHLFLYTDFLIAEDNCNLNTFTIEEQFFNEEIVAFYLGAININTGSSNVLLFDYLVESTDNLNCYNNSDINLFLHFKISIYSPQLGFNAFEEFLNSSFK